MDIEIYSRDGCPYCDMIKQIVESKGWPNVERKLFTDFSRTEFVNMFGEDSTFPRVFIDGILVGGATEAVDYLREKDLL